MNEGPIGLGRRHRGSGDCPWIAGPQFPGRDWRVLSVGCGLAASHLTRPRNTQLRTTSFLVYRELTSPPAPAQRFSADRESRSTVVHPAGRIIPDAEDQPGTQPARRAKSTVAAIRPAPCVNAGSLCPAPSTATWTAEPGPVPATALLSSGGTSVSAEP